MNPASTFIRPRLSHLLTRELLAAYPLGLAAALLHMALGSSSADLWIDSLVLAGAFIIGAVPATLVGWRNHQYSLIIADGKLETRSFLGAPRHAIPIAGLSLVSLEHLSLGQRLCTGLKLTGLDGSSLRMYPANFSPPQLHQLRLELKAHGAA